MAAHALAKAQRAHGEEGGSGAGGARGGHVKEGDD